MLLKMVLPRIRGMGDVVEVIRAVDRLLKERGKDGILEDVSLILNMLKMTLRGEYALERRTTFALAAALLYFLIPTDALLDYVPLVGYVDDAAVLTYVLNAFSRELERFRKVSGVPG